MKVTVEILRKDELGMARQRIIKIDQDSCIVGRGNSDIVVLDPKCSLHHIMLYEDDEGKLNLLDLRSTNGTFLNGMRVVKRNIAVGDIITIGDTDFLLKEFIPRNFVGKIELEMTQWDFPAVGYNETISVQASKAGPTSTIPAFASRKLQVK